MAMLDLFKKAAAFHSVRQISLIALPPLRFPGYDIIVSVARDINNKFIYKREVGRYVKKAVQKSK